MEPGNVQTKQLQIGLIALLVIVMHIALSVYVSVAPERITPRNKLTDVYRHLVVLGPFFTESRITYSHFLSVRYKRNGAWSAVNEFAKENFRTYSKNPWRFDKLPYISYEKQLAYEVGGITKDRSIEAVKNSSAFRELNSFLTQELLPERIDSIQLIGGLDYYRPESKAYALDTLFDYTYNPKIIAKVK